MGWIWATADSKNLDNNDSRDTNHQNSKAVIVVILEICMGLL